MYWLERGQYRRKSVTNVVKSVIKLEVVLLMGTVLVIQKDDKMDC